MRSGPAGRRRSDPSTSSTSPGHATIRRFSRTSRAAARYTLIDYLPDLADALAASDLVLSRAGGSVFELDRRG